MSNYEWKSPLAPYMQEHIAIQQAAGFKFEDQIKVLQFFDRYLFYNGYQETLLEKGMTDGFIYTKGERPYSWRRKELVLHKFGIFLRNKGIQSYVPTVKTEVHRSRYIPHIYTREELKRFFKAVDEYPLPTRPIIDGAMFRFLYSTGVRISEALSLTLSDYDANIGTVIIRHAKNDRDRVIPLHPAMKNLLDCYIEILHKYHGGDMPLFPDTRMTKMDINTAYRHFRDYLLLADIPHTGRGPRIHDFRHGFAVQNLRRWSIEGRDLTNLIPYLSAYMGHVDYKPTQYYLRLTAEIYPEMMDILEAECEDVIPRGGEYCDEP